MFQLDKCSDYEGRRKIRARLRVVMAEQKGVYDRTYCIVIIKVKYERREVGTKYQIIELFDTLIFIFMKFYIS